ncbi:MAG TPA: cyclodeaminase/cyclohydrolase family protein [Chloroflexota bacterium]|nr:cyclodeaminase/cyclohydrolase family protein [Chloroflexota bacterium]
MGSPVEQRLGELATQDLLNILASSAPSPGGGAAASLVGAMAAGLVSMVCNLTIGRPRYASVEAAMRVILGEAEALRLELTRLAEDDVRAFTGVGAAYRLPRDTEAAREARQNAIQLALRDASLPPLASMVAARQVLPLSLKVAAHGNVNVVSDAGVAGELAAAGVRASIVNVRANLTNLKDAEYVLESRRRIALAEESLADDLNRLAAIVRAKLTPRTTA